MPITQETKFNIFDQSLLPYWIGNDCRWKFESGDFNVHITLTHHNITIVTTVYIGVYKEIGYKVVESNVTPKEIENIAKEQIYNHVHRNDKVKQWAQI